MYFIIRFNWNINTFALTNKKTVGYFDTLSKAYNTISECLPRDNARNTVAIVKIPEGIDIYFKPEMVFSWCDQYNCYVPLNENDPRYKFTLNYC